MCVCVQGTHVDHVVNRVADGLTQRAIKQVPQPFTLNLDLRT